MAGVLVLVALGISSAAARTSPAAADGVSCGVIHATSLSGVDTFAVRAIGVSCGLAKKTALVWTINDCGAPDAAGGNRILKKSGSRCVIAVAFDPGSTKSLSRQRTYIFDCRLSGSMDTGTASVRCTYLSGTKSIPLFAVTFSQFGE
jgi:hypothetical protein